MASSSPTPGLLYVTMQPKETLPLNQFHDWYNNEHGPLRLRHPAITNGFRYRATDLPGGPNSGSQAQPEWMACYDISDMHELTLEPYMRLRGPPAKSQREIDTMAQIFVDRKLLDSVGETVNDDQFLKFEEIENEGKGNTVLAVSILVDSNSTSEVDKWYTETKASEIEKVPGWRRTRRYTTSTIEPRKDGKTEYLLLHEFTPESDITAISPLTSSAPFDIQSPKCRNYSLYYTFGAAPRHLHSITTWSPSDPLDLYTKTIPSTSPTFGSAIESYITTPDGVQIPYRLEGSSSPTAPLIVLSNSVLVTWEIWDNFLAHFFSNPTNHRYRVLRYLSRGRTSSVGPASQPVTVDLLASDIIHLLTTLRVPKAHCLIGVSLGGATALATAVTYPSRIANFISCDTSAKSPAGNSKAWGERIAVSEKENATANLSSPFGHQSPSSPAEAVVGSELAELTVRRWFTEKSYADPIISSEIAKVKHMVITNSLAGFKRGVEALFDYNYVDAMKKYSAGKAGFLVGAADGALPKGMEGMSKECGSEGGAKVEFRLIEDAGHLPMVEKPKEVAEFVSEFLNRTKG